MTAAASPDHDAPLLATALHAAHVALGARMVPFAGYDMPVQYPSGILTEHKWTRDSAGLFDVSHMGQAFLIGPDHATTAAALEALVPADMLNLKHGQQRYSQLLTEQGTIIDDLMVARSTETSDDGSLFLVVNAGRKTIDYAHIQARLPANVRLEIVEDRSLIAIQGPKAEAVVNRLGGDVSAMAFMTARAGRIAGIDLAISRSGYTGEDGFEISVKSDRAVELWNAFLSDADVKPIGLGARDSLRLEAGLCLYGHDIDETTTPVEAALTWSIQKRRRDGGGFPGADIVQRQLRDGTARIRVGIQPEGRAPARDGTAILDPTGRAIGVITSGGFGPTVGGPVAMGYVETAFAAPGTAVGLSVRDKVLAARIAPLAFVPNRFKRTPKP